MAKILDGRVVRDQIAQVLSSKFKVLTPRPKLVIIQVGDNPQSNTYIRQKVLFGQKIGAIVNHQKLPAKVSQEKLVSILYSLNSNPSIHGLIIQLPIPNHLDKDAVINAIDPQKDVDGQTAANIKLLFEGRSDGFLPATTKGILTLLDYYKIPVSGKKVVVVGRSSLVGKPTALAFLNRDATVTVCHSKTTNLKGETKNSQLLIVAAGQPKLITKDHVSKGQVVIDVGINVVGERLVGDVDFDNVKSVVAAISPVPGGCGPMTVASLFENLLVAYNKQTSG